jgi:hypothetical protein
MTMKKRSLVPRETNDFYKTPYFCTDALLQVEALAPVVWEPACGDGEISEVLKTAGYYVWSTDLFDRGYGIVGQDFLRSGLLLPCSIVTNPPYKLAVEFVERALSFPNVDKVCMLMRLGWLEGGGRETRLFSKTPPTRVWVCSDRPTLWNGSDDTVRTSGGAIAYAWYVWERDAEVTPGRFAGGWLRRRHNLNLALASNVRARDRYTLAMLTYLEAAGDV